MKTLKLLFLSIFCITQLAAQNVDPGFSYQAIVRDTDGAPVAKTALIVHVELYDHLSSDILFSEVHNAKTDDFGQVNLIIGHGEDQVGSILDIPWNKNNIYYKIDIINRENQMTLSSQAQILAVPYALHALTADELKNEAENSSRMKEVFWNVEGNEVTKGSNRLGSLNNSSVTLITNDTERIFINQDGKTRFKENATFDKELSVVGDSYVGKDEFVKGTMHIGNELEVQQNASILGNLDVYGNTRFHNAVDIFEKLTVGELEVLDIATFQDNVTMNKDLTVNGKTTLNDDLTVANNKTTTLTGDLIVGQDVTIEGTLNSNGPVTFSGEIDFSSTTIFSGDVYHEANTTVNNITIEGDINSTGNNVFDGDNLFSGDVIHQGNTFLFNTDITTATINTENVTNSTITNATITNLTLEQEATFNDDANFQTDIHVNGTTNTTYLNVTEKANFKNLDMSGQLNVEWDSPNSISSERESYPLTVQGSDNGIYVKVKPSVAQNANNFISFFNGDEIMKGRIEGQTETELLSSFPYIWNNTVNALDIATLAAEGIACAAQLDVAEVAVMAAQAILVGAQIVEYNTNSITQVGIAFESGSGDYAEWLERADYQEELSFGDIVGVKGGKISKNFSNPDHFMVVSMSPIVLGNMPKEGFEENFEKIAFMGQVPVKVLGKVNIGDYILASTRKDGMGYAVNPKDLKLSEMNRIVGVAWSESQENNNLNLINVAVGINSNDMSHLVQQQQAELNDVKSQMNQLISYLKEKDSSLNIPFMDVQESPSYPIMATTEKTQEPVVQMTVKTEDSYEMVRSLQSTMKKVLDERNIDYTLYDQTNRLVNDADYLIEMFPEVLNKIMK